MKFVELRNQFY